MRRNNINSATWMLVGCLALGLLAGCGGGGAAGTGSDGGPDPVTVLAQIKASLLGSNETSVIDANARGVLLVVLRSDGTLDFAMTAQPDYVADVTGLHIHRGVAGTDGAIEVDLLSGGATFDATATAGGQLTIDPALAQEIAGNLAGFYANIHTSAAPAGLAREQLGAFAGLQVHATLRGNEETTVVDPDARGAATFDVLPDGTIDFVVASRSPAIGDVLNGHIHVGPAGVAGNIVLDLEIASATLDAAAGTRSGTLQAPLTTLSRICSDLTGFYVNLHTAAAPGGIARGQLHDAPAEFWAPLSGDEEVVVIDASARGGATLQFTSFHEGRVHLAVPPLQVIGDVNQAHIHEGAAGVAGGVVIDLQAGADYNFSGPTGSADGAIACNQTLLTRMLADPEGFYANLHTAAAPGGLVRGQLSQDPVVFTTTMLGSNETVVVDAAAEGTATLVVTGVFTCSFAIEMIDPAATLLTAGHIHDGGAGVDGPVLINLLDAPDLNVTGLTATGSVIFTGRTFARLLAVPELFYANMHTLLAPGGIVRGQMARLTTDTPPAGLTYDTPVTYTSGTMISDNLPSSIGGAITGYTILPALPTGLTLDPVTGAIAGTPTQAIPATDFTVTGSNAAGDSQAVVNITVNEIAPTNLTYTTPVTYAQNTAIAPNTPSNTGGTITSYGIVPALPAGLVISTTTGVISGTPTVSSPQTTYTVTGTNAAGSTTASVVIDVTATLQPPSGLSYATPVTYTTGTAIAANTPTISGGAVATWSVAPALPAGLSLNTTNGNIEGTPTAITGAANYTVTAANAAGNATAVVNITVNLGPPANLTYTNTPNIGYVTGGLFSSMTPSSTGGAVASYAITPALPAGITLNTTTGVVSGTPTTTSGQTNYTVTATNAAGNTTRVIQITILP